MRSLPGALLVFLFCLFLSFPVAAEEKGRAYYDFGVFAYEDGDYEDALGNLQQALKLNPDYPLYLHYLGKIQLKLEQFEAAEKSLGSAYQKDPSISGLIYDLGMLNYKIEKYEKAAGFFQTITVQESDNVLAFYFAGLSYYKMKDYSSAVEYLIKASEASENIKTNGYYYAGISQLQLYEFDQATDLLSYVVTNAESESLRVNASKWLTAVKKRQKAHKPLALAVRFGRKYDDNVLLEPVDQDLPTDESDWLFMLHAAGKYKVYKKMDVEMGVGFSHYQTMYDNLSEYTLAGSTLQFYARYAVKPFLFDLSYFPSFYWLDSDSYMSRQRINPRVVWQVDNISSVSLSYALMSNNHFQDTGRLGETNEVSLDGSRAFASINSTLSGSVTYGRDLTRDSDRAFNLLGARGNLSKKIPYDLELRVGAGVEDKSYRHMDSFYKRKRQDTKYQATVSLSRMFKDDSIEVTGEYAYTKNNSNISDYEYRRNVFSLFMSVRY